MQQIVFANPDLKPFQWSPKESFSCWAKSVLPDIPESVATIEDSWRGRSKKTIILIEDAHTNPSGQLNISKTIDFILQKDKTLKYIFLEAGRGNESISFLKRSYAPVQKRKEIADSLLRNGKLQGVEYLDLTSSKEFMLWGVEDLSLYSKSIHLYKDVVKQREEYEGYLSRVDATIKALKPKIYNPLLLSFDEINQNHQRGKLPLTEYFDLLLKTAAMQNMDLENYPHLRAFQNLRTLESQVDFKKANEEEAVILLDSQKLAKLNTQDLKTEQAFCALIKEKLNGAEDKYPNLSKYLKYLEASKNLQTKLILSEQKELESKLFESLAQSEDERALLKTSESIDLQKKLLSLTLTPEEYQEFKNLKDFSNIKTLTGFLNKKIMDMQSNYDKALFLEDGYEDIAAKCVSFYELTCQRDQKFIQNALNRMNWSKENKAILITGGYHTPDLKYLLKKQNVSYIVLEPQILRETDQKRYEEILFGEFKEAAKTDVRPNFSSHLSAVSGLGPIRTGGLAFIGQLEITSSFAADVLQHRLNWFGARLNGFKTISYLQSVSRMHGARLAGGGQDEATLDVEALGPASWYHKISIPIVSWKWLNHILLLIGGAYYYAKAMDIDVAAAKSVIGKIESEIRLRLAYRKDVRMFALIGWEEIWSKIWAEEARKDFDRGDFLAGMRKVAMAIRDLPSDDETYLALKEPSPDYCIKAREQAFREKGIEATVELSFGVLGYLFKPKQMMGSEKKPIKSPAVILFHGFGGRKENNYLDSIVEDLVSQGWVVFVPDLPGHGDNPASVEHNTALNKFIRDCIEYIKTVSMVDSSKIACFGFSFGAYLGVRLMMHKSIEEIQAVFALNPPTSHTFRRERKILYRARLLMQRISKSRSFRKTMERLHRFSLKPERLSRLFQKEFNRRTKKILVMISTNDETIDRRDRRFIRRTFKNVVTLPGEKHFVLGEKKQRVIDAAIEFFKERFAESENVDENRLGDREVGARLADNLILPENKLRTVLEHEIGIDNVNLVQYHDTIFPYLIMLSYGPDGRNNGLAIGSREYPEVYAFGVESDTPNGARLAESNNSRMGEIYLAARVIKAQEFYGSKRIMVGPDELEILINHDRGRVLLCGLSRRGIVLDLRHINLQLDRGKKRAFLSDFKLMMDEAGHTMQNLYDGAPESFVSKPVVEILKLPKGWANSLTLGYLQAKIHQVKSTRQGHTLGFVVEGLGASELSASHDFALRIKDLPKEFQRAPRIHVISPDGEIQFISGDLYFYTTFKAGDILNPSLFDDASYVARLDPRDVNDEAFLKFLGVFQMQLGHKIALEDYFTLIQVWEGKIGTLKKLQEFSLPPMMRLAVEQMIQAYNLMIKMALQAA